ncbi:MAG: CBS domain-containing protein [Candidatus Devosia phytovorans]|uniref:CBS domain-containing protein n=1 Tax=Candidatus Devosia phytovorans TaxID=3121372 RepID=A0AAJ6B0N5_9HYPH|nr:CBS domain-containing protein [Devosia sp.]WEK05392.1 MAG: CBS domain-containing protein [Devosia sp.]
MLVDTILQTKGGTVHTLAANATLADAVAALNAHNIGALVVTDNNGIITGILSERDIIRRLGKDIVGTMALRVGDVMTQRVITCARQTPVADVMEKMTRLRIRHMPVVDDGRLIGIISIGDVVKRKIEEVEHEADALKEYIAG